MIAASADGVILTAERALARFAPADGFRLTELVLDGEHLVVTDPGPHGDMWWGAFVMAPWTSELPDGAVEFFGSSHTVAVDGAAHVWHGVARLRAWTWDGGTARCALGPEWPWGGVVELVPALDADGLTIALAVTAGDAPMPASVGWHPWFPRELGGATGRVQLPPGSLIQHRDPHGRPTGLWARPMREPLNDGVYAPGPIDIVWGGFGRVRVTSDAPFGIVFDASDHGICVEPTSAPAGSMPRLLEPGESLMLTFRVAWTRF